MKAERVAFIGLNQYLYRYYFKTFLRIYRITGTYHNYGTYYNFR